FDNKVNDEDYKLHMECFSNICENIPLDITGTKLKNMLTKKGITSSLLKYLYSNFSSNLVDSEAWINSLSKLSLPHVLRQLKGLATSHAEIQNLFTMDIISIFHTLEKTTAVKSIGNLAENVLDVLKDETSVPE